MALEITGSRILTPVFGSSTTTWGILIGIILTGLAIGYFLGGRIADSKPSFMKLCSVIFSTGLFILFIPYIGDSLIEFFIEIMPNFSAAAFFSTLLIFGLPAILLGFVSPYAIKLAAKTIHKIGATAGNLYSVATLGSIFGTFLTVFVLIPFFEINHLIFAFGFVMMGVSVIGLGKIPKVMVGILLVVFLVNGGVLSNVSDFNISNNDDTLVRTETPYSSLSVTEKNNLRTMYLDGTVQSTMDMNDPSKLVLYYTKSFHLVGLINPQLKEVLFVGGGGFSGPKSFLANYENIARIDVVEIDPAVIDIAKEYFFVPVDHSKLEIINDDVRIFLTTQTDKKYDAIILDAYSGSHIPSHLITKQFYQLLDDRLTEHGIIISNFLGSLQGQNSRLFESNYKTLGEVFHDVFVFPTNLKNTDKRQNITFVVLKGQAGFGNMADMQSKCEVSKLLECERFFENYYPNPKIQDDTEILTDQFSPVDRLKGPKEGTQVYQEIKNNNYRTSLTGFTPIDWFVQIALILGVAIWGYILYRTWKKEEEIMR